MLMKSLNQTESSKREKLNDSPFSSDHNDDGKSHEHKVKHLNLDYLRKI
jgi:hypothetical protein